MKQFIQVIFLICFSTWCTSQIISIEKIKAVPQSEYYNTKDSSIVFPIFKLKNKKAEQKINQKLLDDFKKDRFIEKKTNNIRLILKEAGSDGLTDLDFEIAYQTKKIISFSLQLGGMGAYPTTWQTQYCFNLETGNIITLDSLIIKSKKKEFLQLVKKKQAINIITNKKNLSDQLRKNELDKEAYQWAINQMENNCWGNYDPHHFTINKNTLTVVIECDFPHAILALSPDSDIKLQLKSISSYFNNAYKYLLE